MPRNGSGSMAIINTFSPSTKISSSKTNANNSDIADEITNSLPRDGQAAMTAPLKLANGSASAPAVTFGSDADIGLFRKGANQIGIAIGGSEVGYIDSDGLHLDIASGEFGGTFSNAAIAAIAALTPAADKFAYFTAADAAALGDVTSVARTLLAQTTQALMRTTGLGCGTSAAIDTGTSGTKVPLLDGDNTHSGANTFSNAAGIVAKNTAKGFGAFGVTGTTVSFTKTNNFNIESITRTGEGTFTVAFTNNLPSANYVVVGAGQQEGAQISCVAVATSKAVSGFTLQVTKGQEVGTVDPTSFDFVVLGI